MNLQSQDRVCSHVLAVHVEDHRPEIDAIEILYQGKSAN